jgi:hypothetical protein
LTSVVAGKMLSVSVLKRTVQLIQQKEQAAPPNSKTYQFTLSENYTTTFDGKPFLLFDSGPGEKRILIFSTQKNLQLMEKCEYWYADGTFSTLQNLF